MAICLSKWLTHISTTMACKIQRWSQRTTYRKSVALRVRPRWGSLCAPLTLGSTALRYVESTKYLGVHVYLKSGAKYSCSCGHLKLQFYSYFNALFSRISTNRLSRIAFEMFRFKDIGVTTLTFRGHVTSSVTWPRDSWYAVSYRWSFETITLSRIVVGYYVSNA